MHRRECFCHVEGTMVDKAGGSVLSMVEAISLVVLLAFDSPAEGVGL